MAILLFVTPLELTQGTMIGGNVDVSKYSPVMENVQDKVIQEMLGTELYDKIIADKIAGNLTGLYLTIFDDFVKPITKFETCADYITLSPYVVNNAGLFKNQPDKAIQLESKEKEQASQWHHSIAEMHKNRFIKWINLNMTNVPEYLTIQDDVDASTTQDLKAGWYFGV
jgi:hypothetical protein|tara:strand:+ start:797 stop:1303 length:507 start_codon:yes stop_codon:yes gene_type:complete